MPVSFNLGRFQRGVKEENDSSSCAMPLLAPFYYKNPIPNANIQRCPRVRFPRAPAWLLRTIKWLKGTSLNLVLV